MLSRPLALVIDDTDAVRRLYMSALRLEGFTVEEAHDGQQGLEKAVALRPDIIITDVAMPVMDGREAIRRLRADDRTRHIPIIVCSAHAGGENLLADAVLEKPFSLHHLLSEVRRLVGGGSAA
jgi:two-component system, cell cycle response regulator DivK